MEKMAMKTPTWADARNLLCVRLDTLGDVIMCEPALRALKGSADGRRVTLLTSNSGAEAARLIRAVDDVLIYSAPWMKASCPSFDSTSDRCLIRQLRHRQFDGAVIFTCFSQSPLPAALLCFLSDIPLRAAHCRENPYQLLTDWVRETEPHEGIRHEVERQLDMAATIGAFVERTGIQLEVPPTAVRNVARKLRRLGMDLRHPWIVFHVGATAPSRRWPAESFAEAADRLTAELSAQIIFTGLHCETSIINQVRSRMTRPSHSLAGALDIQQLAALLSLAPLLVSNNTGPVHVAAGVGTPIVDIYALTNPQHAPWRSRCRVLSHDVSCKYCFRSVCPEGHHECLRGVSVEHVVQAALELWSETHDDLAGRPLARAAS
jgi:lipopolysaccharide heptosyltransferase II